MNISIKYTALDKIIESLEQHGDTYKELISDMRWKSRYYNTDLGYNINIDNYDTEQLKDIRDALYAVRAKTLVKRLDAILSVVEDPDNVELRSLETLPKIIQEYFTKKTTHRWVFVSENVYGKNTLIPYFIHNVYYEPEHFDKDNYFIEAYCNIELHNNGIDGFKKKHITFYNNNINGRTISEAFKDKNMIIETEELYKDYKESDIRFTQKLKEKGKQYKVTQYITAADRWRGYLKTVDNEDVACPYFKVVNDTKSDDRHMFRTESCSFWGVEFDIWHNRKATVCEIPVLPYIRCYNLDTYCDCYCHIDDIEDYVYDHSLRDKLVLPESHKALLDILVNNSAILKGDIINNKGNGTVVILEGPPGCGKTLTTEVYSELMEKPLYNISSGQLGVDASDMDKNLYDVLNRAEKLDCILLIDECETFVKRRGDDLNQNAIITTFLRKIEYFDGIMFLTSNRIKDIDEAILSRCVAAIKYEPPTEENAKKIWNVLAKQFKLEDQIDANMINTLVKVFPTAVGRDIKELLKLTARYCKGNNKAIDIESFLACAQFRYIDPDEEFVEKLTKSSK